MATEVEPIEIPEPNWAMLRAGNFDKSPDTLAFNALMDDSDELEPGDIVGFMLSWPVADGQAWYMVVRESPLEVAHVPYMDAWQVDPIMIRGLEYDDVIEKQRQSRLMKQLFGGAEVTS